MNKVQLTLLTAICIATAFTFLACEEKKKAEATPAETETEAELETGTEAEYFMGDSEEFWGDSEPEEEEDYEPEDAYMQPPLEWLDEKNGEHIRQAAIVASEAFVFNPFPHSFFSIKGHNMESKFSELYELIDESDKHGYGKAFKVLFRKAYNQKKKDMSGWLQPLIKRIASQIPREEYVDNGWDAMVRQLLFAYDDLAAQPNGFSEVYDAVKGGLDIPANSYESFVQFMGNKRPEPFIFGEEWGYVKKSAVVWAYSFWGRRYHENPNNIKPIAATLRMLRDELFAPKEAMAKTKCPDKTDPLQTAEAEFSENFYGSNLFYLKDGKQLSFREKVPDDLKKEDTVSITYQKKQYWDSNRKDCYQIDVLKSLKILSRAKIWEIQHEKIQGSPLTYKGQTYKTVKIGEQIWMAENLNYETEGSICYKGDLANCETYGRLYTWNAAMKACPSEWHLPSEAEWAVLHRYMEGGWATAGNHLKATSGWSGNGNGQDTYGFAALPGGNGTSEGNSANAGRYGHWWSSKKDNDNRALCWYIIYEYKDVSRNYYDMDYLYSVRCVKD
jgi:uncharacterized protein (TIGR02145 family)